jgi:hypothetical protein
MKLKITELRDMIKQNNFEAFFENCMLLGNIDSKEDEIEI